MQFHCSSCQGAERVNANKKFQMARCPRVPNNVSNPNGHISFCSGHVVFE
jgi:hypothetical protein